MGDYISREAAIVRATKGLADDFDAYDVKVNLEAIPAADVVEVVRCSRCEHWSVDGCDKVGFHTPLNWFCADGKRKDGGWDDA